MNAQVERLSRHPGAPKRRLRNYLLEPRFQLKYTLMVVGVTVIVAGVLGGYAYQYSLGQTELMNINRMEAEISKGGDLSPSLIADLDAYAAAEDRKVMMSIIAGILCLAIALGFTGIVITHKMVGPAYKMTLLLRQVRDGKLKIEMRLRKGDELQNVFKAFQEMISATRTRQQEYIDQLDAALEKAGAAGASADVIADLTIVRNQLAEALERS